MSLRLLTASRASSPSSISVLVGEPRTDDSSYTHVPLSAINDHPDYNCNNYDNDYSILTLASIAPACFPSDVNKDFVGELATVSG